MLRSEDQIYPLSDTVKKIYQYALDRNNEELRKLEAEVSLDLGNEHCAVAQLVRDGHFQAADYLIEHFQTNHMYYLVGLGLAKNLEEASKYFIREPRYSHDFFRYYFIKGLACGDILMKQWMN